VDETALILGTAQLVDDYGVTAVRGRNSSKAAADLLEAAWGLGIRTIDTAPAYGDAERMIGMSPRPFTVHTKLAKVGEPARSLARSLENLQRDSVEVLYIHDTDALRSGRFEQLADLIGHGAETLGASIYDDADLCAALDRPSISVIQAPCNVFDRRFRDVGTTTRLIARSAFLQGVLLAEANDLPSSTAHLRPFVIAFRERCSALGLDPLVACLAWVRRLPHVDGVVVGAQSTAELTAIVDAWASAADDRIDVGALRDLAQPAPGDVDPRRWT